MLPPTTAAATVYRHDMDQPREAISCVPSLFSENLHLWHCYDQPIRKTHNHGNKNLRVGENIVSSTPAQATSDATTIRRAQPSDIEVCGRICYEAFSMLNRHHNFPPDPVG